MQKLPIHQKFVNYGRFCKHWIIECIGVALLHYIVGELIYIISRVITSRLYGLDDPAHPNNPNFLILKTGLDDVMPFVKEFIVPYTAAYALWVLGPFLVYGFLGRKVFYRFMCASVLINIACLTTFIAVPNGIQSSFRPIVTSDQANHNFFYRLCYMTFTTDSFDQAFPSGHWSLSVILVIAFRGSYFKRNVKRSQRLTAWTILVSAVLICVSTLLVHQHYIFDAITAIVLCELCWLLFAKWTVIPFWIEKKVYWLNCRLGFIQDKQIPQYTYKSKNWILIFIGWLLWMGIIFYGFWETQWFLLEFAWNMLIYGMWMLGNFIFFMCSNKKIQYLPSAYA